MVGPLRGNVVYVAVGPLAESWNKVGILGAIRQLRHKTITCLWSFLEWTEAQQLLTQSGAI